MNEPVATGNDVSIAGFEKGVVGVTPPTSRDGRKGVFLTDVIVELGFADRASIDEAEEAARTSGKTVEQLLLDNNTIDENQLSLALAERHGLDHVELEQFEVDMRAAESISRSVASRSSAVPIAFAADGALIVAVQDTFDALVVRRLETTTGREVRPAIAAITAIRRLIERLPDEPVEQTPEPNVPRIKSQREIQLDESGVSDEEDSEQAPVEPAVDWPGAQPGEDESPIVEADEVSDAQPPAEGSSSFDGLSMDLGPMNMEASPPQGPADTADATDVGEGGKGEDGLARELLEANEKIAGLERRLEEAVEAAEDAVTTNEKLRALRRALNTKIF